jgi:hypothetical protein
MPNLSKEAQGQTAQNTHTKNGDIEGMRLWGFLYYYIPYSNKMRRLQETKTSPPTNADDKMHMWGFIRNFISSGIVL